MLNSYSAVSFVFLIRFKCSNVGMYTLYIFHEYTQQKMGWVLINKYD